MIVSCRQCGAALAERDAFCTKCGAQREVNGGAAAAARFCTKCGAVLPSATKFCTKCGAEVAAGAASSISAPSVPQSPAAHAREARSSGQTAAQSQFSAPTPAARIPKAAILGALAVIAVLILGGIVSAVHHAREKAQALKTAEDFAKSIQNFAGDSKTPGSNGQAGSSSDADLEKNLAAMQAAANALGTSSANGGANDASNSSPANANPAASAKPPAPYGWTLENGKLVPAKGPTELPMPKADPVVPVPATGDQAHDWALKYERTLGGPEADLVVRTGDINNLGFGWPAGFDPFSGDSTPVHPWPDINKIPPGAPDGTDRIMLGSSVVPGPGDGYSGSIGDCAAISQVPDAAKNQPYAIRLADNCKRERELTAPTPIILPVGTLPGKINAVLFQIFADDFQPVPMHSHFQVSLNGTRIPTFEYAINALDQSGPIGKLLTLKLLPEYWPLLKSSTVKLLIDDPTTHVPDGYAVDFLRILVNPHKLKYEVSLSAHVVDADKRTPVADATVTAALESAATDRQGRCELRGLPAGLVVATASAPGYDENSVPVDLPAGQNGTDEIPLHHHQENTAALEQSIEQTGSATIYGIHFDTNSSKVRPDSLPALNALLGLINNHPGSRWIISGHTDNQGNAALNQPLSEARAKSVVNWLKDHGVDALRLLPQGFGATRPVADNSTANGRALNRRVEVELAK